MSCFFRCPFILSANTTFEIMISLQRKYDQRGVKVIRTSDFGQNSIKIRIYSSLFSPIL